MLFLVMNIKIMVFWDITSCNFVHRFLRSVGTCLPDYMASP